MQNSENTDAETRLGPLLGSRPWLGGTPTEEIPGENSPVFSANVKEAINEQLKGLPRAIMVTTMLQTRLAEHRGSTDADPDVAALMPRMILRVRHAMEQMNFASGDEVDCVYARVKGDHHLLMVLSWSQGSEAFEDEEWKSRKRRIQGPQDHLGRSVERAAKRQGATIAHWQEKGGAGIWAHMQRELAEFEATLGVPRGSFARMIAWLDRLSLSDFLDQQDRALEQIQNEGWPN